MIYDTDDSETIFDSSPLTVKPVLPYRADPEESLNSELSIHLGGKVNLT